MSLSSFEIEQISDPHAIAMLPLSVLYESGACAAACCRPQISSKFPLEKNNIVPPRHLGYPMDCLSRLSATQQKNFREDSDGEQMYRVDRVALGYAVSRLTYLVCQKARSSLFL